MKNKIIISVVILVLLTLLIFFIFNNKEVNNSVQEENIVDIVENESTEREIKEFVITSFVEFIDGSPAPQYSMKEMSVNKGDIVRIKITVTSGSHDFKIDEFGVYADTKLNEEKIIEFIADKSGEFVYYCTKPGHRENGHWGTLIVKE